MFITIEMLRKKNACPSSIHIFKAEWGLAAEVTRTNLNRAVALKLDLVWLLKNLFPRPVFQQYLIETHGAWEEYIEPLIRRRHVEVEFSQAFYDFSNRAQGDFDIVSNAVAIKLILVYFQATKGEK